MSKAELRSPRLRLVAATPELINADLAGHESLAARLGVHVPAAWPPEYCDEAALRWTLEQLKDPAQHDWSSYYLIADGNLVGLCGFKGPPDANGTVEIGYGLVPAAQGKGYATEGATALIDHALQFPAVTRVVAETLPALGPSKRVMERCGMRPIGPGSEAGVIRFELTRADAEAGNRTIAPHLQALFRLHGHMAWANQQALSAIVSEEGDRTAGLAMLGHILGAEHTWLTRILGVNPSTAVWPALSLQEVADLAVENEAGLRQLLFSLDAAALRRNITYRNSAGDEFVTPLEDILLHLFLHGAYHRGQIAQRQRLDGQVPSPSDYIGFARGAPAARRNPGVS